MQAQQQELDFTATKFGGSDFTEDDRERMGEAMQRVYKYLQPKQPNEWFTLERIAEETGVPQSSVGSYLCYLRRDFGYEVPKKHSGHGLYFYQLGQKLNKPRKKKMKAIGDKELFGEMMRGIYACAMDDSEANQLSMQCSTLAWASDLMIKIRMKGDV